MNRNHCITLLALVLSITLIPTVQAKGICGDGRVDVEEACDDGPATATLPPTPAAPTAAAPIAVMAFSTAGNNVTMATGVTAQLSVVVTARSPAAVMASWTSVPARRPLW